MAKIKNKLCLTICLLLLLTAGLGMIAGCDQGEKKYDVAIRIGCSDGSVYEFPVGTDEKHIEIPYDGVERSYYVRAYNLPEHPRWSKEWFSPSGEGANVFSKTMVYTDLDEKSIAGVRPVKEKGSYCICFEADATSSLWNFRYVYLNVSVI